jgi:hypothetical protein
LVPGVALGAGEIQLINGEVMVGFGEDSIH